MSTANSTATTATAPFLTPAELLNHWQGHRRLTRRVIEAFPEAELFTFTLGGMRSFGDIVKELLAMGAPMAEGLASGEWAAYSPAEAGTREELLRLWDEQTDRIARAWAAIEPSIFHATVTAFGQYTGPGHELLMYVIDNEIHHRAQGYVYLRALGVEPPAFWER